MDATQRAVAPQYNFNLTLGSFLSFPSRFIARMRKVDDVLHQDIRSTALATAAAAVVQTPPLPRMQRLSARSPDAFQYDIVAMPGPLAFVTSGYAIGLIAMAVLLNRIQHIVVPPRRSFAYRLIQSRRSLFHAFFYSFFPINLTSTVYRLSFRVPSLLLLLRALSLLTVILLQTGGWWPAYSTEWFQDVGRWASTKEMADVCWSTFGAVCAALVVGSLTRGLEGLGSTGTSPFNLFGYALLLHIYSTPITHSNKGTPSRPDVNVIVTITVPLLQLTMIHFLEVKKSWARQRLVPTTICAMISLIHFNVVLLRKPSSYPLLNYLPSLLETLLLLVTVLTLALNALTQILLEGQITRPLFGHYRSLIPKWDEDFAVVLLRLGTASLEATSVAGLGNEVGGIAVADAHDLKSTAPQDDNVVELTRSGVVSVTQKRGKRLGGFANEFKNVKVNSLDGDWFLDHAWLRELTRFGLSVLAVVRGMSRLLLWMLWYKWRGLGDSPLRAARDLHTAESDSRANVVYDDSNDEDDAIYQRFLRGESISDDEEEYTPQNRALSLPPHGSTQASDISGESDTEDEGTETMNLYADLVDGPSPTPAPVLLAHMTTSRSSPLTRQRYTQLLSDTAQGSHAEAQPDVWQAYVQSRRPSRPQAANACSTEDDIADGMRTCVICTTEPRDIICWPCRCLALCDDCRANLASRFAASKHSCPCCRRGVEGYSKIYIP